MKPRIESNFTVSQQARFVFGKPYVPGRSEFLLNHGRSAVLLALRALKLPTGARVGVMVYNCHTVMNAIEQAGCIPVFVDVDDNLNLDIHDLEGKADGMSALVVTHLFGIVNDVARIKELFPGLVIIEDCAHAYGIENIIGDFATFSLGQGKLPSIGDGGLLLVRNEKYYDQVAAQYDNLPKYSFVQSLSLFLRLLLKSWMCRRFIYGWLTLPLKLSRPIASPKEPILMRKMCRGISAVFAAEKLGVPEKIKLRKAKAEEIKTSLQNEGIQQTMVGINAFMFVVKCECPKDIQKEFRAKGIETATHFANSLTWAKEFGYQQGSCPKMEKLVSRLLMIPTY